MAEKFEQRVTFTPAYDRRHADPNQDYGIHGVECRFDLVGEHGATQLVIYTYWQLPEVTKELDARPISADRPHSGCHPMPATLGYHRSTPEYEGQEPSGEPCSFLAGQTCYYDYSYELADGVFEALLRGGDAGVWRELERFYREHVLGEDVPAHGAGGEGAASEEPAP
jgi:hypothetical protein